MPEYEILFTGSVIAYFDGIDEAWRDGLLYVEGSDYRITGVLKVTNKEVNQDDS